MGEKSKADSKEKEKREERGSLGGKGGGEQNPMRISQLQNTNINGQMESKGRSKFQWLL